MRRIVIIGAGGHGKVVYDTIMRLSDFEIVGFVDQNMPINSEIIDGCRVILSQSELSKLPLLTDCFVVAIGNNEIRNKIFSEASNFSVPATIVHPQAFVGADVQLQEGSVIFANSTITSGSSIGKNTIINANVVVDHDCKIGSHVHLKIGALIGSNSIISDSTTIQIGEVVSEFSIK